MTHRLIALFRLLLAAILALLAFTGAVPSPTRAAAPPEYLLVDAGDADALAWLSASGARPLTDYGAFSLWELPQPDQTAGSAQIQAARPGGLRPTSTSILLRDLTISTSQPQPEPALPDALRQPAVSGAGFWLVQFAGPVLGAWLDALRGAGLEVVSYLPENAYILWGDDPPARLSAIGELAGLVRWQGPYHPAYRLHPALRGLAQDTQGAQTGDVDVVVQVYDTPDLQDTVARLESLSRTVISAPQPVLNLTNLRLRVPATRLAELAGWADVLNIEPYHSPQLLDEIQGQVLAGNISVVGGKTVASAPGYLAWLNGKGFSTNPADYPIVDVIDDGIDQGDAASVLHPDFYQFGSMTNPDRVAYIANCSIDASGNAVGGHGNLNAGIIGGYNDQTGFPNENAAGYQYGLGISPYGRIAGTKMFPNNPADPANLEKCSGSMQVMVQNAYGLGARLTSDSWGVPQSAGVYDADAQLFDLLTRDASSAGGNQAMLHVFAAGNDGAGGSQTVNTPGTAKNVLTVGAAENPRDNGISCNGFIDADNANDIAPYSSRGRAADGRAKPDIVAPGTHVQGPASQDPGYQGTFVCPPKYYPANQTLYAWSVGTSHSTPAVSGGAQLTYEYYKRILAPGQTPSPAMVKALLLNSPRYLNGVAANDTLPGQAQGWGMLDLGRLFDAAPRMLTDQTNLLASPGSIFTVDASVVDPTKPLRVSLVWTDTPGSAVGGAALVNDLDLEVTAGGTIYKGNVFNGALSIAGGAADTLNNVENVFLPAGTLGNFQVRVIARNLPGDGVPLNGIPTDQDFALVIYNATGDMIPNLSVSAVRSHVVAGNQNSSPEPGETLQMDIDLSNLVGSGSALNVSASLSVIQGTASLPQATSAYPDLLPDGAARTNLTHFLVAIDPAQPCGGVLALALTVTYTGGQVTFNLPPIVTALPVQGVRTYAYAGPPVEIPDRPSGGDPIAVQVPIPVGNTFLVGSMTVSLDITHTFVGDLIINLQAPNLDVDLLASRRGNGSDNYANVTFDDTAARPISTAVGPFSGSYRPEQPLSIFNGLVPAGTWNLVMSDNSHIDAGRINAFSLTFKHPVCTSHELIIVPVHNSSP